MDIPIILLMGSDKNPPKKLTEFPPLYALSKTGSIRIYQIVVEDMGDYAEMRTIKQLGENGKKTIDTYKFEQGVNIGKSNETTYLEQAMFVANSNIRKLYDSGFSETLPNVDEKFNTDANGKLKPMLAIAFDADKIQYPCLCQPKYDGVRCTISKDSDGIHIISRKGKPYNIPHLAKWASQNSWILPLDGEIYTHKNLTFQQIVSSVKKLSGDTSKLRYVVYDKPVTDLSNRDRWRDVCADFEKIPEGSPAYRSDGVYCSNFEQVTKYHTKCVKEGYEGIIIRNLETPYAFGFRSSGLIKMKDFYTDEFMVEDVLEATGRDAGTAVFRLYLKGHEGEIADDTNTFNAKPQGTRELRKEYFDKADSLIGAIVTVQYQGFTDLGKPRFPSAICVRDYE